MLYRKVECPHCGNEIVVTGTKEPQKCCWCRRLVLAKFKKLKKNKVICEVEAVDFPDKIDYYNNQQYMKDKGYYRGK